MPYDITQEYLSQSWVLGQKILETVQRLAKLHGPHMATDVQSVKMQF